MIRQVIARSPRQVAYSARLFSASARTMAEGDAGGSSGSRPAGKGDAFSKREKANEDMYVQQAEREKLLALRQKLQEQGKNLNDLTASIDKMLKESDSKK